MVLPSSVNTAAAIRHDRNGELRRPLAPQASLLRLLLRSSPVAKLPEPACSPRKCVSNRFLSLRNSPGAAFRCTKQLRKTALLASYLCPPEKPTELSRGTVGLN